MSIKPKNFDFSQQNLVNRIFCPICGIPFQQADEFKNLFAWNSSNCEILNEQKNFRMSSVNFFGFVNDPPVFPALCATSVLWSISTLWHFLSERRTSDSEYRFSDATSNR